MAWVKILPGFAKHFRERSCDSFASFFHWAGILVNRHRRRQVEEVSLDSNSYFLKKEHALNWRERFRNFCQGFGWCATVVREAATLQAARDAGIGCPEVVAFGADGVRAFLLLRDESKRADLRRFVSTLDTDDERNRLADTLGREFARLHAAGFQHPDLFAKHILVGRDGEGFRICILDWARARQRRSISPTLRWRDLAALDATLHESLASDRLRLRCLRAYCGKRVPFASIATAIRQVATGLRRQRNIREVGQLPTPAGDQAFVPCCDGRLLAVRSYHESQGAGLPTWLNALAMGESPVEDFAVVLGNASSSEVTSLRSWPSSSEKLEIPQVAHTLFRLQRYGVPAPRLLAVGQAATRAFVVTKSTTTVSFERAFAAAAPVQRNQMLEQAGQIVRRVHEAGYFLHAGDSWGQRLGVVERTGDVVLVKVDGLPRRDAAWRVLALLEFRREPMRLSPNERMRFLRSYLGRSALAATLKNQPTNERQLTA